MESSGRRGLQTLPLGQLAVLTPSNRKPVLSSFGGSPRTHSTGHGPLGTTSPHDGHLRIPEGCWGWGGAGARISSGSAQTLLHQPLPGLGSISPPPSSPSAASQPISGPLSRLVAPKRRSGVDPGLCSSRNCEKLRNISMHSWRSTHTGTGAQKFLLQEGHCCQGGLGKTPLHPLCQTPARLSSVPPPPQPSLQPSPPPRKPPTSRAHSTKRSTPPPPSQICCQIQGWGRTGGTSG